MPKLHASSVDRRMACPGSFQLEQKIPRREKTIAAKEGDVAHWVASEILKGKEISSFDPRTPAGDLITPEMVDGAKLFEQDVYSRELNYFQPDAQIPLHMIHPDSVGVADMAGWSGTLDNKTRVWEIEHIYVWDYKFGHAHVDVFENWQLLMYAVGLTYAFSDKEKRIPITCKVHLIIVQPRNYQADPIREWVIYIDELIGVYQARLTSCEQEATQPDALCKPSKTCGYCPARTVCRTLQVAGARVVDLVAQNSVNELSNEALSLELQLLQDANVMLEARLTGLEEQALIKLQKGERIPSYQIGYSNGKEAWSKPAAEIKQLGQIYGVNLLKPEDVITPAQAVKAKLPVEIKNKYTTRNAGSAKLEFVSQKELSKIFKPTSQSINNQQEK